MYLPHYVNATNNGPILFSIFFLYACTIKIHSAIKLVTIILDKYQFVIEITRLRICRSTSYIIILSEPCGTILHLQPAPSTCAETSTAGKLSVRQTLYKINSVI